MKKLFITLLAICPLAIAGFWFYNKPLPQGKFYHSATNAQFSYTETLKPSVLSEQDLKDKVIWRAQAMASNTPMLVTVRYEEGIRRAASATRQSSLDTLLSSANKALPLRYSDYRKLSERKQTLNGYSAAEITFEYKNQNQVLKQRFLIIMRDDDMAVYVAAQVPDTSFDSISKKYFDQIFSTIRF